MQESPLSAEELKQCVKEAFADVVYPGEDNITISACTCSECSDTREFFGGKHWQKLVETDQNLMFLWGGLAIMSPEAWRFYLPAYLISGLGEGCESYVEQNRAEEARQCALWSLSPPQEGHSWQAGFMVRASCLSFAQQVCIAAYARAMSTLEPEEENYAAAAAFWTDTAARADKK